MKNVKQTKVNVENNKLILPAVGLTGENKQNTQANIKNNPERKQK